jgi:isopentenyl diphosphate isomerase/L-lactate dehydrogenase-like FMN-dependent dehydrogenase
MPHEVPTGPAQHEGLAEFITLADFEPAARANMTASALAYCAGGAADEITLRDNVAAFRKRKLRPRVLVDLSSIDTSTSFLGTEVSVPVGLAPAALNKLAHPDGEAAAARAAAAADVLFCISTLASCSLEEVGEAGGPRWFQLYLNRDRGLSAEMVKRAAANGYSALVLTVDLPVVGYRDREFKDQQPIELADLGNLRDLESLQGIGEGATDLSTLVGTIHDVSLTWRDLEWLRGLSDMPLVIKGILTPEDARLAVENGADGVIVSNHGGRQLDHAPATIDVLEDVVAAVNGGAEVFLDGGVRRGTDVLIALALGARGVFIGRPYLYALATAGEAGVARALEIMTAEIFNAMSLLGVRSVSELTRAHVL